MKSILLSIPLLLLPFLGNSQEELNKVIIDPSLQQEILYGHCSVDGLKEFHLFLPHYVENYEHYETDIEFVKQYGSVLAAYEITIVLGTWCSDSQLQVPRFLRLLNDAGYAPERIVIIATDRKKEAKVEGLSDLNVERVPTFIFYLNEKEAGRIVETPVVSFEADISRILRGEDGDGTPPDDIDMDQK